MDSVFFFSVPAVKCPPLKRPARGEIYPRGTNTTERESSEKPTKALPYYIKVSSFIPLFHSLFLYLSMFEVLSIRLPPSPIHVSISLYQSRVSLLRYFVPPIPLKSILLELSLRTMPPDCSRRRSRFGARCAVSCRPGFRLEAGPNIRQHSDMPICLLNINEFVSFLSIVQSGLFMTSKIEGGALREGPGAAAGRPRGAEVSGTKCGTKGFQKVVPDWMERRGGTPTSCGATAAPARSTPCGKREQEGYGGESFLLARHPSSIRMVVVRFLWLLAVPKSPASEVAPRPPQASKLVGGKLNLLQFSGKEGRFSHSKGGRR